MKVRMVLVSAAAAPMLAIAPAGAEEAEEPIVIVGAPLQRTAQESASSIIVLSGDELNRRRQATLGETLAEQPGVNLDNFGAGASRPVIRGQTAPRVRALADGGEIHDASAISPDHAVATEPMLLRGIEVFRGPAALLYGGGAIGGAVNLLDERIPIAVPARGFSGIAEARGGAADDERTIVGGLTLGAGPFALRLEGVDRQSEDYRAPSGFGERRVPATFNETQTYTIGVSWIGDSGYFGLAHTNLASDYGIPGHSHGYEDCHPHGATLHCGGHDEEEDEDHDHEAHAGAPFIDLASRRTEVRSDWRNPLPGFERARLRASYTDYRHREIEPDDEDHRTTFTNRAYDLRLELEHAPLFGALNGAFGLQYARSDFGAFGEEAFAPSSETETFALFLLESIAIGRTRFEIAARQELQDIHWADIESGAPMSTRHRPFSISAAAIHDLGAGYMLAATMARSQRAPNVQELAANGIHLATNTFELGTPTLEEETAISFDLTLRKTSGATTFTLGAYHVAYDDYIFAETLDQFEDFRLIAYAAADARFTGLDGEIRRQLTDAVAASLFGDLVRAEFADGGDLPRIPAARLGGRLETQWGAWTGDVEYFHVFRQRRIAAFETETPGYDMLNASLAYTLPLAGVDAQIFVRGANLGDALALSHASFIKAHSPLRGRNVVLGVRAAF